MSISRHHSFWGSLSPLGGLMGISLLVMASARLSWAITIAGCLFWVYGLTAFSFAFLLSVGKKIIPEKGRSAIYSCLAAFFGSVYLFLFWLLCPFAALETFMLMLLVPLFCAQTGFADDGTADQTSANKNSKVNIDVFDSVSDSVSGAASLAVLIIAFSILREPLSYCLLSFPGTAQGMVTIMYFKSNSFFPIGVFASSAGALLLLGYCICLYQYGKGKLLGRI
ncbi:MAG: hypothetical protein FWB86_00035 [Treponema sp.]|nr:hypothetical protein [Treponema sp.]MCL2251560.1 hypothetical protein [Treponema sp.]